MAAIVLCLAGAAACRVLSTPVLTAIHNQDGSSRGTFVYVADRAMRDARSHCTSPEQADALTTPSVPGRLTSEQLRANADADSKCLGVAGDTVSASTQTSLLRQVSPSLNRGYATGVAAEAAHLSYRICNTTIPAEVTYEQS